MIGTHSGLRTQDSGLLASVRASCAAVAARATRVRIVEAALPAYAAEMARLGVEPPTIDPRYHYLADPDGTLAYFLALDTINFGSGYFPQLRKRPGLSGYFNVALALKEAFERDGVWDAARLATLSTDDCARNFGQDPDFPLMALFARALHDYGRLLLDRYDGRPAALLAAAAGSAERLVALLAAMPYYRDVAEYDGQPVAFYKRAQLAAGDLALALSPAPFHDLDRLTIFADNLVPHVLRVDGVLTYAPDLLARIDAGELIAPGSPDEIELRACALHAVECLAAECARQGHPLTACQLDYYLWNRGQGSRYKALPRHRARSIFY